MKTFYLFALAAIAGFLLSMTAARAEPPEVPPGLGKNQQQQGQAQGQIQAQGQLQAMFQKQKASASSRSSALAFGLNKNLNKSASGGNTIQNRIEGDDYPVSTAVAGSGVQGDCMASSGVGAQSAPFGISIGSNWFDEKCRDERRAKLLKNPTAAKALLCRDDDTREAYKVAAEAEADDSLLCPQDRIAKNKDDLKKATYWRDPNTGQVHRMPKTAIRGPNGQAETIAWHQPRVE